MSKEIVQSQQGSFDFTLSLVDQFLDICPENIWVETFGGWPVWQQLYHALSAIDFFVMGDTEAPTPGLFEDPTVAHFNPAPGTPPTRMEMKEYAATMKKKADAYFARIKDSDLAKKNLGLSVRTNMEWDNARTVIMLSGHILYHLGSCDAALRQHGLKGVF